MSSITAKTFIFLYVVAIGVVSGGIVPTLISVEHSAQSSNGFDVPILLFNSASAETLTESTSPSKLDSAERQIGPFLIKNKEFVVSLKLKTYNKTQNHPKETVESFVIVDETGKTHYKKSFKTVVHEGNIIEAVGIWGHVLESCNQRSSPGASRTLRQDALKSCEAKGLILYYGIEPSAPGTGVSCQVFAYRNDRLVPLFSPLTVYGRMYELPQGSSKNAVRLFDNNTMKFGVWTGWFEVIIPVRVLDGLKIVPKDDRRILDPHVFNVQVRRRPSQKETSVKLFESLNANTPIHVEIMKHTKVEFLWAFANVSIKSDDRGSAVSIDGVPLLKVRIDDREGFIKDKEDLLSLGIHPAG